MNLWFWTLGIALLISACSGVGYLVKWLPDRSQTATTFLMTSAAAGFLLGGGFLHLLPDALEHFQHALGEPEHAASQVGLFVLSGIVLFFILEKGLRFQIWSKRASSAYQTGQTGPLATAQINLLGDSLHNFTDGIVLSLSFMVSVPAGLATSLAMLAHELPQELSDVGILLKGGYSLHRAVWLNFLSSLPVFAGVLLVLIAGELVGTQLLNLIPVAAGGLIYIALTHLLPEMQVRQSLRMHGFQAGIRSDWRWD